MERFFKYTFLLFSYSKSLYYQRPKLFYFLLFFSILQLTLTIIKLEVTPFFLFGMYSEKQSIPLIITKTTIFINKKDLRYLPASYREREILTTSIENYLIMKNNNGKDIVQSKVEDKYHFLTQAPFYPFVKARIFNQNVELKIFEKWFKQKCSKLAKEKIDSVDIAAYKYKVTRNPFKVKLISSEKISSF